MKPAAIAMFGVIFLLLAAGGVYFYMTQPSQARDGQDPQIAEQAEPVKDAFFVELSPLILSVVDDRGMAQIVSVVVSVEVDSQIKADRITKFAPRLTDAYLSDLYGILGQKTMESGKTIPVAYLKERLNKVSDQVMGDDVVSDVLLQVFQQRGA